MDPGDSRLLRTRKIGESRIAEVLYPAGMRQPRHRHSAASFSFVAVGRYQECIGRQDHSRQAATLIYHPADEKHAVSFESDVRILSVEVGSRAEDRMSDALSSGTSHRSGLIAWLGARLCREIGRSDNASGLAIDGLISEMLAEGSRGKILSAEKGRARWLHRATDFVHANFIYTFSLEEAANAAGVHSAHLSRVFRETMGCTVGEYVRKLRFEFACHQILSTEMPLCEVALTAGFSDQSHFNRTFRQRMGMTPFAYRKIHTKR